MTDGNNIGAFVLDKLFNVCWNNDRARGCFDEIKVGCNATSLAPTLDWAQFANQAISKSVAETVAKNANGSRVLFFMFRTHDYFVCLCSLGIEEGSLAVGTLIHDIKSPITLINHCISGLCLCDSKKSQAELLSVAERNCAKALRMSNDLLSLWYKNDISSSFEPRPIFLGSALTTLCKEIVIQLKAVDVEFSVNNKLKSEVVSADRDAIERVILNLLCNAIRYAKSKITLGAFAEAGMAHVVVENDGEPIKKPDNVFDLFVSDSEEHHGIGLFISRHIAQVHGGTLTCDASRTDGASFELSLPLTPPSRLCAAHEDEFSSFAASEIQSAILEREKNG